VKGLFRWLLGKYFANWDAPYLAQVGDWVVIARQPEPLQAFIRATIERRFLSERLSWASLLSQEKIAFGLYIDAKSVRWLPAFLPASTIATWQTELAPWESGAFAIGPSESGRLRYELLLRLAPPSAPPPQQTTAPALSLPTPDREDSLQEEYYPNGVLKKRAFLVNSQLEGEYVEYHPNGLIKVQGYYEQGKKVGIWRYYDKKGTLLREETWSTDTIQ
jgi:hypothetical protein